MEIKITHTITLAPEVLTLLQAFLGKGQAAPATAIGATPSKTAEAKAVATVETKTTEPVKEVAATVANAETLTVEQVREFAQKKILAGKLAEVKELLTSFEAKSITALDAKHYSSFVEKVKAL